MNERNQYVQDLSDEFFCHETALAWGTRFGCLKNYVGWGYLVGRTFSI